MPKLTIPEILMRVATLDSRTYSVDGETVTASLQALCQRHPQLEQHFFYDSGQLKEHFMLVVGGALAAPDTSLSEASELEILLAASGGSGPPELPHLSEHERARYARHIMLPQVGENGQRKLKAAKVLIVGTGGLGSPVSMYLAAAGVGTIGLIDFDVVDQSNLQRQIVHSVTTVGAPKVLSAKQRLQDINDQPHLVTYDAKLNEQNAHDIVPKYDVIVDGCDNYETRYLINRVAQEYGVPYVYGAIFQFDGQVSVFLPGRGPCYQCLHPEEPPPAIAPNANNKGVFGVLPGVVGLLEATEALKLILGIGNLLAGRLLIYDALSMRFRELAFQKRPACRACGTATAELCH
ncbi:molybdopterin-synthase adenylyltransferase MoeB [Pseudothauera rhizosphaerae]|uniref:Molybdopterin-synthase adenylyltransferase n=1 Tax=Pseudothauera rhizosphaerae TaxID=2565932 RepID=A0A4S4AY33_9RHOO|nr:molybdopterin-synthase adenylyltransferase MoeB [Pseudothauera rhizosphaerae]THF63522.1 molybdopterin-synthase adenylyltransferase MoeB [Pseudothauera rhizosphaerae]